MGHKAPPLPVPYSSSEESATYPSFGGREVHDETGGSSVVFVLPGRLMVRRRRVGGAAGVVLLRDRLQLRLHGGRFLVSGGLSVDDIVDGTQLRDKVGVRCGHGLLAHAVAFDLAFRRPVLHEEGEVLPLLLMRLLER